MGLMLCKRAISLRLALVIWLERYKVSIRFGKDISVSHFLDQSAGCTTEAMSNRCFARCDWDWP